MRRGLPPIVHFAFLLLLISLLTACFARRQDMSKTGQQANVQVLAPAPTGTAAPGTPTSESLPPTLTPSPTFPLAPTPTTEEGKMGPTPTVTPTPAKIVDLAAGGAPTETMVYIVQRADGSEEKWLVSATLLPSDLTYLQARDKLLKLGPQDRIVDAHPQALPPMSPGSVSTLMPANSLATILSPLAAPSVTGAQWITTTIIDYAADILGVVVDENMQVLHVEVDSAADKAGIQVGDILDTLNGISFVKERQKVKAKIHEPNFSEPRKEKRLKLKFKRGDKALEVDVSPRPPTAQPVEGTVTPVWAPQDYF